MIKGKLHIAILFLLLAFNAAAQGIRLTVVDRDSRKPVSYAYANVYESPNSAMLQTTQADENGVITLTPSKYPCKIEIVSMGYEAGSVEYNTAPINMNMVLQLQKKASSLNELVVTGVSQPTKLKDALSTYYVIPQAVIRAQGAVTLNDVLKNQLNMTVNNDNILGSSLNMQVGGGDKVKILMDGVPVNGRENGSINLSQLNLNNVDRIEIVQGPMSVVYGTDAVGGVINIITKKELKPFDINIKGYYESVGKYNSTASVTFNVFKRHQFTLGGGRNMFLGYENIDQPKWYNGDSINTQRVFMFKPNSQNLANFAYNYTSPSGFKADLASDYIKDKTSNKGSLETWDPYKGAFAIDEYYVTDRSINRLSLNGKLGKTGRWNMQNGYVLYYRVKNRYYKNMVTMDQTLTPGLGEQDTSKFEDVTSRGSYSNNINKLQYTVGYDIALQYGNSLKIATRYSDIKDYALYTNVSYPLVENRLTAQVGLRAATNSKYAPPAIPSVNLLFTPLKNLQIRGSYAQGYRAPSLKELYLSFIDGGTHDITGNPNLKAEESKHMQLSASYQFYEKQADYLQCILTGYYNDVRDGIALVNKEPQTIKYTYLNIAHQSNTIGSFQIDGQLKNIHLVIGYSYKHNFAEPGQYNAFGASELTGTLQYRWRMPSVNFNVFCKYNGKQPFLYYNEEGIAQTNGIQESYSLMDASIERAFMNKKIQLIFGCKNIFNVRRPQINGAAIMVSSHGSSGGIAGNFLPRSIFTSLNVNLD